MREVYFSQSELVTNQDVRVVILVIKTAIIGGARGVIVIVVGNERGDTSSNPGRDWLHFT